MATPLQSPLVTRSLGQKSSHSLSELPSLGSQDKTKEPAALCASEPELLSSLAPKIVHEDRLAQEKAFSLSLPPLGASFMANFVPPKIHPVENGRVVHATGAIAIPKSTEITPSSSEEEYTETSSLTKTESGSEPDECIFAMGD